MCRGVAIRRPAPFFALILLTRSNTQTRSFPRTDLSYMQTNVARTNRQKSLAAEL